MAKTRVTLTVMSTKRKTQKRCFEHR